MDPAAAAAEEARQEALLRARYPGLKQGKKRGHLMARDQKYFDSADWALAKEGEQRRQQQQMQQQQQQQAPAGSLAAAAGAAARAGGALLPAPSSQTRPAPMAPMDEGEAAAEGAEAVAALPHVRVVAAAPASAAAAAAPAAASAAGARLHHGPSPLLTSSGGGAADPAAATMMQE